MLNSFLINTKKRSYLLVASLFLFLIGSCGKPNVDYVLKVKTTKLQGNEIFDKDLVLDMVFDAGEFGMDSIQRIAKEVFLLGLDEFKNKKNPAKAIMLFKKSLLCFPDAKTYYELGNALQEFKTNEELLNQSVICYDIASELSFKPEYTIHFKKARSFALISKLQKKDDYNNFWEIRNELWSVFEFGYFDTNAIKNDPVFDEYVESNSYKDLIIDQLAKLAGKNGSTKFDLFKNSFTNFNPDLVINDKDVSMSNYRQSISYEFSDFIPEMENVSFGREVSNDFYYVAKVAETENYVALVYATSSFWGEGFQPVETILAVYDQTGKQISRKLISCRCGIEKIKTCSFSNGQLSIEEKKINWEKPVKEFGIDENQIKSTDIIAKAKFNLESNGKIKGIEVPVNFNDSGSIAKN